ncbi:unnamed protein product [Rodentolepis nana]|uniref:BPTI/Kunitz inhibitor domain-containing protein n=1 Tax=Rodentolepis nana TaxID=102285 RepID=A0A0R3TTE9_RODNA|nr:unnamed protein product [Rodentolepis nana]
MLCQQVKFKCIMKKTLTLLLLYLFGVLAVMALHASAIPAPKHKPGSPEAKKAYEDKLAICKDSSKEERCKWLARFFVYYDCFEPERECAYVNGENGCMKKTLECIRNVTRSYVEQQYGRSGCNEGFNPSLEKTPPTYFEIAHYSSSISAKIRRQIEKPF